MCVCVRACVRVCVDRCVADGADRRADDSDRCDGADDRRADDRRADDADRRADNSDRCDGADDRRADYFRALADDAHIMGACRACRRPWSRSSRSRRLGRRMAAADCRCAASGAANSACSS